MATGPDNEYEDDGVREWAEDHGVEPDSDDNEPDAISSDDDWDEEAEN